MKIDKSIFIVVFVQFVFYSANSINNIALNRTFFENTYNSSDTLDDNIDVVINKILTVENGDKDIFDYSIKLMEYPISSFSDNHKLKLTEILKDSSKITNGIILLAGKLKLNVYDELVQFISSDSLGHFDYRINIYSKEWCTHLAFAKMGIERHITFIEDLVIANAEYHDLREHLLSHLTYIGGEMTIQTLMDYALSDKVYDCSTNEGFGTYLQVKSCNVAYFPCLYLSKILEDFPVQYPSVEELYSKSVELKLMQKWVIDHRVNYQIKDQYFEKEVVNILKYNNYFYEKSLKGKWLLKNEP